MSYPNEDGFFFPYPPPPPLPSSSHRILAIAVGVGTLAVVTVGCLVCYIFSLKRKAANSSSSSSSSSSCSSSPPQCLQPLGGCPPYPARWSPPQSIGSAMWDLASGSFTFGKDMIGEALRTSHDQDQGGSSCCGSA